MASKTSVGFRAAGDVQRILHLEATNNALLQRIGELQAGPKDPALLLGQHRIVLMEATIQDLADTIKELRAFHHVPYRAFYHVPSIFEVLPVVLGWLAGKRSMHLCTIPEVRHYNVREC
jgi:hypothetical protein